MKPVIHMVGIKGQGMTALAEILKARGDNMRGAHIIGSDTTTELFTTDAILKEARIPVRSFARSNITEKVSKVIYSTAYRPDTHPELKEAARKGIPIESYTQAIADLFNSFTHRVLITGTHGKSTTSAMVGYILEQAGYDPTVIVGGKVLNWKRNSRVGYSNWIVAEGDEYQAKILLMKPTVLVLTNIDYDHPDFFPTKTAYQNMFRKMKEMLPANNIITLTPKENTRENMRVSKNCYRKKMIHLFGIHNQQNAELAARAARIIGIKKQIIDRALQDFRGVARRLEYHSDPEAKAVLLEDYAHHPTEVKAALGAVRERYPHRKIVTVFQPHTFSRTAAFFNDFTQSFTDADAVIFLKTYGSAREKNGAATAEKLAQETAKRHPRVFYAATHKKAVLLARRLLNSPAVLLAMGAGDVNKVLSLHFREDHF